MPKLEYWKEYWNLLGDPFSEEPLLYSRDDMRAILVENLAIEGVNSIINEIEQNLPTCPRRIYIIGGRGMGKSTVLNYVARAFLEKLSITKILPVYVNTISEAQDEEKFRLGFLIETLSQFFRAITVDTKNFGYINDVLSEKFKQKQATFFSEYGKIDLHMGQSLLIEYVNMLLTSYDFRKIILIYDELDKITNKDLLLLFLRKSQGLFETLSRIGCILFIAGIPDWISFFSTVEYSGIRGQSIELRQWSSEDAVKLINSRYSQCSVSKNPFSRESVEVITNQTGGRPRDILSMARSYLILGASENVSIFDEGFSNRFIWKEESIQKFISEITRDENVFRGYKTMKVIFNPERDDPDIFRLLCIINNLGRLKSDTTIESLRQRYGLDIDMKKYWDLIEALKAMHAIRHRKEGPTPFYELERELKALFGVVTKMRESINFLPHIARLGLLEQEHFKEPTEKQLNLKPLAVKVLISSVLQKLTIGEIARQILADEQIRTTALMIYAKTAAEGKDEYALKGIIKDLRPVLNSLIKEGLIRSVTDEGELTYVWLPRHINWKQYDGLSVDPSIMKDLDSAAMSYREGHYDSAATLCRSAVEGSLRILFKKAYKSDWTPIQSNWTIDEFNNILYKEHQVYERGLYTKILSIQFLTNPIVHKEVKDISEALSGAIRSITEEAVKDIFTIIKALSDQV